MGKVKAVFPEIKPKSRPNQPLRAKDLKYGDKDWWDKCSNCEQSPTVHPTGLCGPCCFGESETYGGNW